MSRDPIEEQGGLTLHGFVGNRPLDSIDYLGMQGAENAYWDLIVDTPPTGPNALWYSVLYTLDPRFAKGNVDFRADHKQWYELSFPKTLGAAKGYFTENVEYLLGKMCLSNSSSINNPFIGIKPFRINYSRGGSQIHESLYGNSNQSGVGAALIFGSYSFKLTKMNLELTNDGYRYDYTITLVDGLGATPGEIGGPLAGICDNVIAPVFRDGVAIYGEWEIPGSGTCCEQIHYYVTRNEAPKQRMAPARNN